MVTLSLESKRFNCHLELKEKVTFLLGDSASGKTEMVNKLRNKALSRNVTVSDGFSYEILDTKRFQDLHNIAFNSILKSNSNMSKEEFYKLSYRQQHNLFKDYWEENLNAIFDKCIIIVDDNDFIDSIDFALFFNADKYNYYLLINRSHISTIGYSVSEIYNYKKDGINHYLEKRHEFGEEARIDSYDYIIIEGTSSDYIFFKSWLGDKVINPMFNDTLQSGGRAAIAKMIMNNASYFNHKKIVILVDYVAFGSDFESLVNACNAVNATFYLSDKYLSFEYCLLKSNLINDVNLDSYVNQNRLKFKSLETLFTERLSNITVNTVFSYSKKSEDFSVCYHKDCCRNPNYQVLSCDSRLKFYRKDKFFEMFKDTEFEYLLDLVEKDNG